MINESIQEIICVGLPGPTHHYGGLSTDNVAAVSNKGSLSNPKQAALQALELVRLLISLGVEAAILPPQLRPHMGLLRQRFQGDDDEVLRQAAKQAPELLEKASSASAMWTANAATVTPAADSADHKLHLTVANLYTNLHRRIEAEATYHVLRAIFKSAPQCEVHPPLNPSPSGRGWREAPGEGSASGKALTPAPLPKGEGKMRDEGAANHMRLSPSHSDRGLHVFVYGGDDGRQDLAASQAIAAQQHIPEMQALFIKQNPDVIRAGVFHNDVIAVSNEYVLLAHEKAYAGGKTDMERIAQAYEALHPDRELIPIIIAQEELTVDEVVRSYFFNSQIVSKPSGMMAVIAPVEVKDLYGGKGARLMERIRADITNPIDEVHYIDLRQSMRNGGGPACLRLRVPMTGAQIAAVKKDVNVFADEKLLMAITKVIEAYYPDQLSARDLGDPEIYHRGKKMMEELSRIMKLQNM